VTPLPTDFDIIVVASVATGVALSDLTAAIATL
jgi:hypothetical protein